MMRGPKFNGLNDKVNGHFDLQVLKEYQEQKFDNLESVLRRGFDGIIEELRASREQGHIPVSVAKQITDQQKQFVLPIIKFLCMSLIVLVVWFTGLKAALPHIFPQ